MNLTEVFKSIADAIRGKTGKEDKLTPAQMVSEIKGIQTGGGNSDALKQLIDGTLASLYDEDITHIRTRVFGYNDALKEVNLPNAKTIGQAVFASATALETVKLDSIETLVISGNQDQQFYSCSNLKNVSMNSLKTVGGSSFDGCSSLKQIYLPSLTRVGGNGFIRSGLEIARFPNLSSIGTNAFNASKLVALILQGSTMATLDNVNAFSGTPIANGTGYIYVPRALLSDEDSTKDYRRATNWINFSEQFRAVEDYPEVCGGGVGE